MIVPISWSKPRSKAMAVAFSDWLPKVIQSVDPWMSDQIEKGAQWTSKLTEGLKNAKVGIVCLTPENLGEPWILFEAGALSNALDESLVCTYLLDLSPLDIEQPLSLFQHTEATEAATLQLVETINHHSEKPVRDTVLKSTFERWWPDLQKQLLEIQQMEGSPKAHVRDQRDILEELLSLVREIRRELGRPMEEESTATVSPLNQLLTQRILGEVAIPSLYLPAWKELLEGLRYPIGPIRPASPDDDE